MIDSGVIPNIEDLSEPERPTPSDPKKIEEINQMITNIGRKTNFNRKHLAAVPRKVKRSNSHSSNKTSASTVTVISKHSIPPELLKSRDVGMSASSTEDLTASRGLSALHLKSLGRPRERPVRPQPQLESVLEVF